VPFDHPLFIMYSSGTTGVPKCIVHGHGGTLLQHMKELMLHCDLRAGERIFYFTTCGWMMWNWLVSGLGVGATVVLYEGNPATRRWTGCGRWPSDVDVTFSARARSTSRVPEGRLHARRDMT
jgi:acyl-coenzyme A synthetase/AMP-(fatty) acid ligase